MKMEFELDVNTLGDLFKTLMFQRGKTYRDVASETGLNLSVVWRFSRRPFNVSADKFIALWKWMAINEDELICFWKQETNVEYTETIYPNYYLRN